MAKATDARIAYRGSAEDRRKLKITAAEKDTSIQKILDEAVAYYFSRGESFGKKAHTQISEDDEGSGRGEYLHHPDLHGLLDEILDSGLVAFQDGIQSTLISWGAVARAIKEWERGKADKNAGVPNPVIEQLKQILRELDELYAIRERVEQEIEKRERGSGNEQSKTGEGKR
jgi:hypothetical protein